MSEEEIEKLFIENSRSSMALDGVTFSNTQWNAIVKLANENKMFYQYGQIEFA